ncbi:MAG: histidine phosphatase family protein [Arenimonas sp.]
MKKLSLTCFLLAFAAFASFANAAEPAARIIYLVRHGHYVSDPAIDEKVGPGISPIGAAQAHMAGARLAGLPAKFDTFYVSPMQRARDTAAIIGQNFPGSKFNVVDDLAECTPPTRDKKIMADEKPEDLSACTAALNRVFATYFKPAQNRPHTELFVCHGNVIRSLVVRALGVDADAWLSMSVGHTSITKIRIEADGRFKVIAVGDIGHLPPNLLTGASGDPDRSLAVPVLP